LGGACGDDTDTDRGASDREYSNKGAIRQLCARETTRETIQATAATLHQLTLGSVVGRVLIPLVVS